ncbi:MULTISPECIES: hypothetical protein [unclassified Mycobacterium]|uniref:hypothetical protein n=1 Tax=unclassified Mycobacterium TaxID=2642494 RepID=UPI0029C63BD7|nr:MULTISPECIES: hypothetical protein [unclassified Mycobacterium]
MSRGRYCETVDLGEPYGVIRAQLTKPRAKFTDAEWAQFIQFMRTVHGEAAKALADKASQQRITLIAAALPSSVTLPSLMSWEQRVQMVTAVMEAAAAVDAAGLGAQS